MNHTMLLDCTLRDGAYLVDKMFGDNVIKGIVNGLANSHIDCIEIGFFQNEGFGDGKTVYRNSADAKKYIPHNKMGCLFTVMADCSRYSMENLDECCTDSVDAVRECFFKEERYLAIDNCKVIMKKGYKCFVQPVDIMGYSDKELIELIQMINEINPYCFSIVDTFGSMYTEDLHRVYEIINHNLINSCKIGFHSHNNMQLSNSLSQEFIRMTYGKRRIIVDGTISGMGRGAGNTPTELIAQYLICKMNYKYDIDALLDVIDDYMDNIRSKCSWGYSTPHFMAGCYGAHVNNLVYLAKKNSIRNRDIRYILNRISVGDRKRYNYKSLESAYLERVSADISDLCTLDRLSEVFSKQNILMLAPGNSVSNQSSDIMDYIRRRNPIILGVNYIPQLVSIDWLFVSNLHRYSQLKDTDSFKKCKKIITSNVKCQQDIGNELVVSFIKLIKCGWDHLDNSTLMALRLLDKFDVNEIALAGFDGYRSDTGNYATEDFELLTARNNATILNAEIQSMFSDYIKTRNKSADIIFVTESIFAKWEEYE